MLIDGKALAAVTHAATRTQAETLTLRGVKPCLAIVLAGDFEPSRVYVRNKMKAAARVGIETRLHELPADCSTRDIIILLGAIAADPDVHGVIVQMPLPAQVDTNAVLAAVPPAKDVDGLSPANLGLLLAGQDCFVPATPQGCMLLIKSVLSNLAGKRAVVVGRSRLVGKPLGLLLLAENATVTIAHSHTAHLDLLCSKAQILIAAAGTPHLIKADWVAEGAVVIDVGITRQGDDKNGKLVGDVDFAAVEKKASYITPVPGGVGPMTIACLLRNTVAAAAKQASIPA